MIKEEQKICKKCGNKISGYYIVCDECFSKEWNLPTNVTNYTWVYIGNPNEKMEERTLDSDGEKLKRLIQLKRPILDPSRNVVIVGELEISVREQDLDALAEKSGLLEGKWLISEPPYRINEVWKVIAPATYGNELGILAKVSTIRKSNMSYVICVYTNDYLDITDVKRVRKRLMELGFTKRLDYKPDIYTYLGIYSKTFPSFKPSRYALP